MAAVPSEASAAEDAVPPSNDDAGALDAAQIMAVDAFDYDDNFRLDHLASYSCWAALDDVAFPAYTWAV